MKYIKQFFSDFGNLSKREFSTKYLLPPVTILFIWVTLGNIFELTYSKHDLEFKKGAIIDFGQIVTKVIDKPLYKGKEQEFRILIENYPAYFRLTDNFDYTPLLDNLKVGDTVTIYYRKKYLVPLGFGRQTDIYQLEYKNQIIFDLTERKNNSIGLVLMGAIASIIFGGLYVYRRKKSQ